jgi:hypothetical protein
MFAHFALAKGWHYNKNYNIYQKVNGGVFVYVSRLSFGQGYMVQLYLKGHENMQSCQLEAKTSIHPLLDYLFELGEEWLIKYSSGDLALIHRDKYSISNPHGVWGSEKHLEKYWITKRGEV